MFLKTVGFLTLIGVISVYAQSDDISSCLNINIGDAFTNNGSTWEENLKDKCIQLFESLDCMDDFSVRLTGRKIAENLKARQAEGLQAAEEEYFVLLRGILTELCSPGTRLHKAYLEHAPCISTLNQSWKSCKDLAFAVADEYEEFLENDDDEELSTSMKLCIVEVYKVTCVSARIEKKCGSVPESIFSELIHRSKFLNSDVCHLDEIADVKKKFLSGFLDISTKHRSVHDE